MNLRALFIPTFLALTFMHASAFAIVDGEDLKTRAQFENVSQQFGFVVSLAAGSTSGAGTHIGKGLILTSKNLLNSNQTRLNIKNSKGQTLLDLKAQDYTLLHSDLGLVIIQIKENRQRRIIAALPNIHLDDEVIGAREALMISGFGAHSYKTVDSSPTQIGYGAVVFDGHKNDSHTPGLIGASHWIQGGQRTGAHASDVGGPLFRIKNASYVQSGVIQNTQVIEGTIENVKGTQTQYTMLAQPQVMEWLKRANLRK